VPTTRATLIRVVAALAAGGAALLLAWLLRGGVPDGLPPTAATPEAIELPVTSRFLPPDYRIDGDPLEVAVTADGRLWYEGSTIDGESLVERLAVEADRRRDLAHPSQPSERPYVVWADGRVEFGAVRPAILAAIQPEVRIHRVYLAARPPFRNGAAPLPIPRRRDRGIASSKMVRCWGLIVRLERREGGIHVLVLPGPGRPLRDLGAGDSGFAELRGIMRGLHARVPDASIRMSVADEVPLTAVVRALDLLEPLRADLEGRLSPSADYEQELELGLSGFRSLDLDATLGRGLRGPPKLPLLLPRSQAGSFPDTDDLHAIALLLIAAMGLVILALSAGRPRGITWILGLKLPIGFLLLAVFRKAGQHQWGSSTAEWAVPTVLGILIWIFAEPRRLRRTVPFVFFLAAVALTSGHRYLTRYPPFTGDPSRIANEMAEALGREERLWTVAERVEELKGLDILPAGPLTEAAGLNDWTRKYTRDAGRLDVRSEACWHTFFTGIYRVVPACPDLEIVSPGGPSKEAVNRLEFHPRAGRATSR